MGGQCYKSFWSAAFHKNLATPTLSTPYDGPPFHPSLHNSFLPPYQQLAELCRRDSYDRSFDRYKLVAILVFGPRDLEVRHSLKYNFERLHKTTGKDFAFIAFLNPPERWKQEHPDWMNTLKDLSSGLSTDGDRIVTALRSRFGLPLGPSILLTDNLRSNHFAVIPTDAGHLVGQMEEIGQYASHVEGRFPVDDEAFTSFLSRYDSVFVESTEDGESVAKNIVDILAIDSLFYKSKDYPESIRYIREEAGIWVSKTLQELLSKAHSGNDEQSEQYLKRYTDYLALSIGIVDTEPDRIKANMLNHGRWVISSVDDEQRSRAHHHDDELLEQRSYSGWRGPFGLWNDTPRAYPKMVQRFQIPEQVTRYLTDYSKQIRENYNRILPFIFQSWNNEDSPYPYYISSSKPDFAPLGLYMGLIMEEEMNASVVQLSRKNAGIRMPDFYRLWDEGNADLPAVELINGGTVFLNGRGRKRGRNVFMTRTIPIGQAVCVVRAMRQSNPDLPFGYFGEEPFLSRMGSFAKHRNQADHSGGIFDKKDFKKAHHVFSTICEKDLCQMADLKKSLMSQPASTPDRNNIF